MRWLAHCVVGLKKDECVMWRQDDGNNKRIMIYEYSGEVFNRMGETRKKIITYVE